MTSPYSRTVAQQVTTVRNKATVVLQEQKKMRNVLVHLAQSSGRLAQIARSANNTSLATSAQMLASCTGRLAKALSRHQAQILVAVRRTRLGGAFRQVRSDNLSLATRSAQVGLASGRGLGRARGPVKIVASSRRRNAGR